MTLWSRDIRSRAGPLRDRDRLRGGSRTRAPRSAWMLRRGNAAQRLPVRAGASADGQLAVSDGQHGEAHGHDGRDRGGGDTDEHDREWIGRHAGMDQNSRGRGSQEPGVQEAHAHRVALVNAEVACHECGNGPVECARVVIHGSLWGTFAMHLRHVPANADGSRECRCTQSITGLSLRLRGVPLRRPLDTLAD